MEAKETRFLPLVVGAVGIIYGDIGTSPLYAVKKCFGSGGVPLSPENILGLSSIIIWTLILTVSLKYLTVILRADNKGEGGILALSNLCMNSTSKSIRHMAFILALLGGALFYGDGIITPAISVLGALEGLSLISPRITDFIPLLAMVILIILFFCQRQGTAKIGNFFGPIMILWFSVIALIGAFQIFKTPEILKAINPFYGLHYFKANQFSGFLSLGGVVLVITGAEALYADMGHFNKSSIRFSWFTFVFPALVLNYLGQGALLLSDPETLKNSFYLLVPSWALYPLIFLATIATIIASQAVISGMFSITWQAIQMGYIPRLTVIYTSVAKIGRVYVPFINNTLLFLTVLVVHIFKTSDNLGSAYGVAVTGIMVITTILAILLHYDQWKWNPFKILFLLGPLLMMDLVFFSTSLMKIFEGGWLPLLISFLAYMVMTTWRKGREILALHTHDENLDLSFFLKEFLKKQEFRLPGTAVFMTRNPDKVPQTLKIHLEYNQYLHECVIFLSVITTLTPKVPNDERVQVKKLGRSLYQVKAYYGYKETPNINNVFTHVKDLGIEEDLDHAHFIVGKGIPVASESPALSGWQEKLFVFLGRNALDITEHFKISSHTVIEFGIWYKV